MTFPDDETGDGAMANRYAQWTKNLMDGGYWAEALSALERAADFSDVSSDISYLLALARSHEAKPRVSVLEALYLALAVDRWVFFEPETARLLLIDNLIAVRAYQDALAELARVRKGPEEARLTLKALAASNPAEFRRYAKDAFEKHPRETSLVRIFLGFIKALDASGKNPAALDLELLELVNRRLPLLLPIDPELAWMAAPFMRDTEGAKRRLLAYRALNKPQLESIPASLKLGIINEESALEELFASSQPLDKSLLDGIWKLLRREEARAVFGRNLSVYTGVLYEDADEDGIPETLANYIEGTLKNCVYDINQDGIPDLTIHFEAGDPRWALALLPPESSGKAGASRKQAELVWERYPSVLEANLDGVRYIPRPLEFQFTPVLFDELLGSKVLFPRWDSLSPPLTRRILVLQSFRLERPSLEFPGGREVVEIEQGIPIRAREYVGDLMVSETDFLRGRPQLQWVDLDCDGHKETVRYFSRNYRQVELEDLWNYDRNFNYVTDNVE